VEELNINGISGTSYNQQNESVTFQL